MNVEEVIAALHERFDPAEAAVIEAVLRRYAGTVPDARLLEEAALAIAIHRRGQASQ